MNYKKIFTLLLFFLTINPLFSSEKITFKSEIHTIRNMEEFKKDVLKLNSSGPKKILLVFDIDETIIVRDLTKFCQNMHRNREGTDVYICESDQLDKVAEIKKLEGEFSSKLFDEISLSRRQNNGYEKASICLVQNDLSKIIEDLQSHENIHLMTLTSRPAGDKFISNTINELSAFGIDFKKSCPPVIDEDDKIGRVKKNKKDSYEYGQYKYARNNRWYNLILNDKSTQYKDGIYQTSWQKKSKMLADFIKRNKLKYDVIFAIDNSERHVYDWAVNTFKQKDMNEFLPESFQVYHFKKNWYL